MRRRRGKQHQVLNLTQDFQILGVTGSVGLDLESWIDLERFHYVAEAQNLPD